jgi:hypothetical protein
LGGALVFSIILAVLFLNLFLFLMKATGNLEYLSFGKYGLWAFLESFPYLFVIGFIIFIFLAGFLMAKSESHHKKYFIIILILFILISGCALAYTKIPGKISEGAYGRHPLGLIIRPLFHRGMERPGHGIAGIVSEIKEDGAIVQTPEGEKEIDLAGIKTRKPDLETGQFIIAIGEKEGETFKARDIRIMEKDRMPFIRQRILQREGGENFRFEQYPEPPFPRQSVPFLNKAPRQLNSNERKLFP